ncbi:glycosyltransferase family 4 protein [Luteolibacter ambystomatis]|uniref:Glycosyltransferase family 4 protein n=1 Tax=Luteolibacter ambystomatis TaxID=2824561 RepID=A0A975IYH8_9BACT|nr:glycosyltransferase family 4 protein [Luteolibacter ambystomatis]QUE50252.1 glycosyltransferase family 4 protein [Luteolibacter ambystomatis]
MPVFPAMAACHKILMAGVVPPPVHGQSLATRALFDADLAPLEKALLEIRSSNELGEVGKASLKKGLGLISIVARGFRLRFKSGARVLYYTPGSAAMVPFVRDVIFLGLCRPLFRRTVLHYHSGGLPEFLNASPLKSFLGRWIYGRGAWAVCLSKHAAVPGKDFGAEREFEIANGLDVSPLPAENREGDAFQVLFVGNLYEDKGVLDLVTACKSAAARIDRSVRLRLVGKWPDEGTRAKFEALVADLPANLTIDPPAPAYGDDKWQAFAGADVFGFPSYYRAENFPLVLIEAMACGLPVAAYAWRGAPSIVEEGGSGFLVQPHDTDALADRLVELAANPDLRNRMGARGRDIYEQRLTLSAHLDAMRTVLVEACEAP